MENKEYGLNSRVVMKKGHPCGTNEWEISRLGADIKIRCPVTTFICLIRLTILLSWVFSTLQVQATYNKLNLTTYELEKTLESVENLLNYDGIKFLISEAATNFISFTTLSTLLIALIGLSIAQATGFFDTFIRRVLVKVDNKVIYHAGDLNWWHWNGESDKFNKGIAGMYKKEIDKMKDTVIDVAFVPVDPRLEENYILGLDYIMKTIKVKKAFPMHFWKKYDIYNTLQKDERSVNYRNCVVSIQHMNELFVIKEEEV